MANNEQEQDLENQIEYEQIVNSWIEPGHEVITQDWDYFLNINPSYKDEYTG
jgi:hypothetical protein